MKKRIPLFYAVIAIFWYALYTYVPYISPYSEYLEADLRLIGIIVGAYGFTQMVIRFPLGILSDKLGKRKIFVLSGLFFTAISGIIVFIAPHPYTMLISRSLGGVAAASWVIFAALGASYYRPEEATKFVGFANSANAMGRILAFLTGGLVAEILGVPHAFLLGGLAGGIGLIAGLAIVETGKAKDTPKKENDNKPAPTPKLSDLLSLVYNRQLLSASILAILSQYVAFSTAFGFTPLLGERLGATHLQLGMLGMAAAIPGLLVSPLAGTVFPKKLGARNTIALGFFLSATGTVLLVFVANIWQLYAVQILISAGLSLSYTLLMGLSIKDISSERRATAMGFFQAVYGLGMFTGPFITGWIGHQLGLGVGFFVTAGVGVLGMIAVFIFARRGYVPRGN
ncbi:MAG: MFS transporter [Defluviitaleaceae bacterium]|nr:MFS transporter [Defluviitaleaceae bacterium]